MQEEHKCSNIDDDAYSMFIVYNLIGTSGQHACNGCSKVQSWDSLRSVILHFVTFILLLYLLLYLSFYSVDALDRVAGCVSEDFAEKVREFIEQVRILNLCY
jgi:hypothetical protein